MKFKKANILRFWFHNLISASCLFVMVYVHIYFLTLHAFIICLLAGLSPDLQSMEQIRRIMRPTDVPDTGKKWIDLCYRDNRPKRNNVVAYSRVQSAPWDMEPLIS